MRLSIQDSHSLTDYSAIQKCRLVVSLPLECNFGVLIESPEWQNKNLIINEGTKDQENEAEKLEDTEVFSLSIERYYQEKNPNDHSSRCVNGRSLSGRSILCDRNTESIEASN